MFYSYTVFSNMIHEPLFLMFVNLINNLKVNFILSISLPWDHSQKMGLYILIGGGNNRAELCTNQDVWPHAFDNETALWLITVITLSAFKTLNMKKKYIFEIPYLNFILKTNTSLFHKSDFVHASYRFLIHKNQTCFITRLSTSTDGSFVSHRVSLMILLICDSCMRQKRSIYINIQPLFRLQIHFK